MLIGDEEVILDLIVLLNAPPYALQLSAMFQDSAERANARSPSLHIPLSMLITTPESLSRTRVQGHITSPPPRSKRRPLRAMFL